MGNVTIPLEFVAPVVLALIAALKWMRDERASERKRADDLTDKLLERTELRTRKREATILLREALRERDPDLPALSYDDSSKVLEVEYEKDSARVRDLTSIRPSAAPTDEARAVLAGQRDDRLERRLERYGRTGDPSTPPEPMPRIPSRHR